MKMRHALTIALFGLASACPVHAIDFTLRSMNIRAEALTQSATYITDGDSKIMLTIPNNWKASDSPSGIEMVPDKAGGWVTLSQVGGGVKALNFDEAGRADLFKKVTGQVPNGATNVQALPVESDVLPIFHWTSAEFTLRYDFGGQKMRRSVLFINMLPGRVVQLTVTAPDKTFDDVHNQARVMLANWFEPKRDLPPDIAKEYESGEVHGS